MKNFLILHRIPLATMDDWMKNTPDDERKSQTEKLRNEMDMWLSQHSSDFADPGAPLGKTKTITSSGIHDSRNDLMYFAVVEADSLEEAAQIFPQNPHLQIRDASVDVIEILDPDEMEEM